MRKLLLVGACIIALLVSGCGKTESPVTNGDKPPASEKVQKTREQQAEEMMAQFVEAVNKGDAETVARLSYREERKPLEMARAAIEDYRFYFNNKTISRFEKDESSFEFQLVGADGKRKKIVVIYVDYDNTLLVRDEFLFYSYRSRIFTDLLIKYIKDGDPNKLAELLNPDDLPYPVSKARKAIANYKKAFDTETLRFKVYSLKKENPEYIKFTYAIYGSKGKRKVTHLVEIVHGDGLVGIRDSFVPENK